MEKDTVLNPKAMKVLQAARHVFFIHGFSGATTDMIQREAKVSKSTVYAHFPNKEALFIAVIEFECAAFTDTVREITFVPGKLRETLTSIAQAYLAIVLTAKALALFRVVVAEAPRFPDLAHTLYQAGPKVIYEMTENLLVRAEQMGEIDLSELGKEITANQFISLVRSEPQLQCLLHPEATPSVVQIDKWANDAVTTFLRAYGKR
ncbi:TetR/AcrR family transcriptional regulator [uncultured Cedecea sp.]|uniref:TetR/AcrR family transcriptional regulator n=1 Tax=uncultured Cedecea sp. TaxID=988762 RepID=UPI002623034C|nr:TetR/AcrR family transcriptional regulator [uncultured Cedecea sp.]